MDRHHIGRIILKNVTNSGEPIAQNLTIRSHSGFDTQFRHGLPVSLSKPIGTIEVGQNFKFEENENVGVLQGYLTHILHQTPLGSR